MDPHPSMDPGANETAITSGLRAGPFLSKIKAANFSHIARTRLGPAYDADMESRYSSLP
jgi:hypothetical protein